MSLRQPPIPLLGSSAGLDAGSAGAVGLPPIKKEQEIKDIEAQIEEVRFLRRFDLWFCFGALFRFRVWERPTGFVAKAFVCAVVIFQKECAREPITRVMTSSFHPRSLCADDDRRGRAELPGEPRVQLH